MKQINGKIRVTQRNINKVLDYISTYKKAKNEKVFLDDDFYNGLTPMNETKINQTLNTLQAENVIEIFPPKYPANCSYLKLTPNAFAYRLHRKQDNVRYNITTAISVIALIGAYRRELSWLLRTLMQLLK